MQKSAVSFQFNASMWKYCVSHWQEVLEWALNSIWANWQLTDLNPICMLCSPVLRFFCECESIHYGWFDKVHLDSWGLQDRKGFRYHCEGSRHPSSLKAALFTYYSILSYYRTSMIRTTLCWRPNPTVWRWMDSSREPHTSSGFEPVQMEAMGTTGEKLSWRRAMKVRGKPSFMHLH